MPIVTFTTDFGTRDGYAGAMKGVVLSLAPQAQLVDITHGIPPHDVMAGAVALAQAAPLFPAGTIHVAVVDPGVGGTRADIVVAAAGQLFVGPDNGVLSLAAKGARRIHAIAEASFRREPVSPTFHGRDVFAPAAGQLAAGAGIDAAGPLLEAMVDLQAPSVRRHRAVVEGEVIHIDGFGNLISSIPAAEIPADATVEIEGAEGRFEAPVRRTFSDVDPGALIAYVGSGGQLEIARRDGSAAEKIGAARGSAVRARPA